MVSHNMENKLQAPYFWPEQSDPNQILDLISFQHSTWATASLAFPVPELLPSHFYFMTCLIYASSRSFCLFPVYSILSSNFNSLGVLYTLPTISLYLITSFCFHHWTHLIFPCLFSVFSGISRSCSLLYC